MAVMLIQVRKGAGWDFYEVTHVTIWEPVGGRDQEADIAAPRSWRTGMPNRVLCDKPTMLLELQAGFYDYGANIGFVATDWAAIILPSGTEVELKPSGVPLPE